MSLHDVSRWTTALLLGTTLVACTAKEPPPSAASQPSAGATASGVSATATSTITPEVRAQQRAQGAAKALGGALKGRLQAAMQAGSVPDAVKVCAEEAAAIRTRVEAEKGVKVGRASLRLRSPANAAPEWVDAWLKAQGERSGVGLAPMSTVVATSSGAVARFIAPIVVEAVCINCHGAKAQLKEEIRTVIDARYPQDAAVGYALGDLRGALWAEAPVTR